MEKEERKDEREEGKETWEFLNMEIINLEGAKQTLLPYRLPPDGFTLACHSLEVSFRTHSIGSKNPLRKPETSYSHRHPS